MTKLKTVFVPCNFFEGMFHDEYGIEIELVGKRNISLFIERDLVLNPDLSTGIGYIKVLDLEVTHTDGHVSLYLPKEAIETGSRVFQFPLDRIIKKL